MASPDTGRAPAAVNPSAERVTTILSCVVVDRRIGGVIFIDLPPGWLIHLASWLCRAIAADPARIVTLGSADSEDDLWWRPAAGSAESAAEGGSRLLHRPCRLAEPPHGPPVAIIPDLARASLPVTQAVVSLSGADTAVVDRHGQHVKWEPRTRWLAACARADLGRLSPHLLDRFPVRIDVADLDAASWSPEEFRAALADDHLMGPSSLGPPPQPAGTPAAGRPFPSMGEACARLVVKAVGAPAAPARRDLALGRLARALAALGGSEEVRQVHVHRAAALVGLAVPDDVVLPQSEPAQDPVPPPDKDHAGDQESPEPSNGGGSRDRVRGPMTTAGEPGRFSALKDVPAPPTSAVTGNYAEDGPEALPEFASLRRPWQWRGKRRAARGLIVGSEATREMADLSIMSTVLEAAKYQRIRHVSAPGRGIVIYGADLRRNRRQGGPDTAIAIVLDHTCRRKWDWTDALTPYLGWAYTQRAAVTMVELGHRDPASDLRADVYRADSVLDRRIAASLSRSPGRASPSPLAYGLDLAIQHLRRQVRYGAASTDQAWLVVVSDGRGNVPLEASLRGQLPGPIGREGIDDALTVAAGALSLSRVRSVVIAPPGLAYYPELPFDLAKALGGIVADLADGEI